jgi:hypothetical protein
MYYDLILSTLIYRLYKVCSQYCGSCDVGIIESIAVYRLYYNAVFFDLVLIDKQYTRESQ